MGNKRRLTDRAAKYAARRLTELVAPALLPDEEIEFYREAVELLRGVIDRHDAEAAWFLSRTPASDN
jgi:hypothetical protein